MPAPDDGSNNHWVEIDVAMEALDIGRSKAFELAKSEQWRSIKTTGMRSRQYLFADIARTYQHRKAPQ